MDSHWYVVQVMSGQEKKAKRNLEENRESRGMVDFIEEVVIPSENVIEVKKGQQKVSEKRLWPGYALVKMKMTDEAWQYVKETNGVIDFLGGGKPVPLSEAEVQGILADLKEKKGEVVHKHKFSVGDYVKVVEGVFEDFKGTILEIHHDRGKLSVMVSIFGRDTRIDDLEFWQVEEAQPDREGE